MEYFGQLGIKFNKLIKTQGYIAGRWVSASTGKTYAVKNPANGEEIGVVPNMDEEDCKKAISAAQSAFPLWKNKTGKERSDLLRNWFNLMKLHCNDLAVIITSENGKPMSEAIGEVIYGASFIEWYAEEAKRIQGEIPTSPSNGKQLFLYREPIGVIGMITPWNFPNAMLTRKVAPALAAGCTCVVKPAEDTPFTALAAAALAEEAGLPKGVFNVITSDKANAPAIGQTMCQSDKIAGLSFTGSTAVGKILYKQCANSVKRLALELGGNAPFIVFDSANLEAAVAGLMAAKFRNAGQACISANRIFVQENIYDKFLSRISQEVSKLKMGKGTEDGVRLGPLINANQMARVRRIVENAIDSGAKVLCGGKIHSLGGLFFEPTILTDCTPEMACFQEEVFGPVISIHKFKTEEEVLVKANDSKFGLASYFFSQDVSQVMRVCRQLETGIVGANEGMVSAVEGAFGGIKESGIGREGSRHGIDDYTDIKYVTIGNIL